MKIGVVVPTYKNRRLLVENLKKNLVQLNGCDFVIVNDYPGDEISEDLNKLSREIKLISNQKNIGFGGSVNKGVSQLDCDLIVLLNSDAVIDAISFSHIIQSFNNDKNLFAISAIQKDRDSYVGKNKLYFARGLVIHSKSSDLMPGKNAWAEGGACILRKKLFDILGGFDEIYSPFYWEDIDISYRAYKMGWHILFDPEFVVIHNHESTIGKYFNSQYIKAIAYRNQFIFTWKNIDDFDLRLKHIIYLPYYLFRHILKHDIAFIKGFIMALTKILKIIDYRIKKTVKYSDRNIFSIINQ